MTNAAFSDAALSGATFTIGGAFGRAFEVLRGAFGRFAILALIAMAPTLVSSYYVSTLLISPPTPAAVFANFRPLVIGGTVSWIFMLVAQVSICYGAYQEMRGQPFSIGQSFSAGLKRVVPAFFVMVVMSFLIGLGFMLVVVPGIMVICLTYVAVPVCVVEQPGITASISRSRALTKGYRWQIFGLLVIAFLVSAIVSAIGRGVLGGGFSLTATEITVPALLFNFVWTALLTAFTSILAMVVYHQLRVVKEGVDIQAIAGVFD
jgi:uncharacterized membrane protein